MCNGLKTFLSKRKCDKVVSTVLLKFPLTASRGLFDSTYLKVPVKTVSFEGHVVNIVAVVAKSS